jgi:hypothetical protein
MDLHEELSNVEILTLVIYWLGGAVTSVDLEDAAVEAFNLAPKKFSWIKYADQIDLRIVQYAIRDACKSDINYLKGTSKHGYMLTELGFEWAKKFDEKKQLSTASRKMSPSDLIDKEIMRLQATRAYQRFIAGDKDKITIMDFREFTRVNDYFPEHIRKQRYSKIDNAVKDDADLKKVWNFIKKKFAEE